MITGAEGLGQGYILPQTNRYTAADILKAEYDKHEQEALAAKTDLAKQMLSLENNGTNLLPQHQEQIRKEYEDIRNYAAQNRKSLENRTSPERLELDRKIESAKEKIANGVMAKKFAQNILTNQDEYDLGGIEGVRGVKETLSEIGNMDLGNFDYTKLVSPDKKFDEEKYLQKISKQVVADPKLSTKIKETPLGNNEYEVEVQHKRNISKVADAALSHPRYKAAILKELVDNPEISNAIEDDILKQKGAFLSPDKLQQLTIKRYTEEKLRPSLENAEIKRYNTKEPSVRSSQGGGGKPKEEYARLFENSEGGLEVDAKTQQHLNKTKTFGVKDKSGATKQVTGALKSFKWDNDKNALVATYEVTDEYGDKYQPTDVVDPKDVKMWLNSPTASKQIDKLVSSHKQKADGKTISIAEKMRLAAKNNKGKQ